MGFVEGDDALADHARASVGCFEVEGGVLEGVGPTAGGTVVAEEEVRVKGEVALEIGVGFEHFAGDVCDFADGYLGGAGQVVDYFEEEVGAKGVGERVATFREDGVGRGGGGALNDCVEGVADLLVVGGHVGGLS